MTVALVPRPARVADGELDNSILDTPYIDPAWCLGKEIETDKAKSKNLILPIFFYKLNKNLQGLFNVFLQQRVFPIIYIFFKVSYFGLHFH